MAEFTLRAIFLWDDPPPSLRQTPVSLSLTQASFVSLIDAPSLPGRESIRRTEGDPHFWLLDHIQVLTRNSDDSASTVEERRFHATLKDYVKDWLINSKTMSQNICKVLIL